MTSQQPPDLMSFEEFCAFTQHIRFKALTRS